MYIGGFRSILSLVDLYFQRSRLISSLGPPFFYQTVLYQGDQTMKLSAILVGILLISSLSFGQSRSKLNVIGDVAVLNMLHDGKAVDVRNLVAVATNANENPIRIERSKLPNTVDESIKLIVPVTACEKLPAYVLYRNNQLYFFLDHSKRSSSTVNAICNKFEISYTLNTFNLEGAISGPLKAGLAIPRPIVSRPFEFIETQSVASIPVPFQLEGSYILSIEVTGEKIRRADLSITNELGQPTQFIQTLP